MIWIALKMLVANRGKYLGSIGGVTIASLLISNQSSIFCGVMQFTFSQIRDVHDAEIWVMDPNVRFADDVKPMSDNAAYLVRSLPEVEWAVRFYKGITRARLPNGNYQQVILMGLDDATLIGAPQQIVDGSLGQLRQPNAVLIDEAGYRQLWPGEPYIMGRVIEMSDRRAVIVGVCKCSPTFQTFPVLYTRYNQAITYVAPERRILSFVLAKGAAGYSPEYVCQRIRERTGYQALTQEQFKWTTLMYYLRHTAVPINFGITISLGFLVGTLVAGQTFYLFTIENLPYFAMLKAMGASNRRIVGMILLQGVIVGSIGYGLGIGPTSFFAGYVRQHARLAYYMPWQVLVGTAVAVILIVTTFSLTSIRRVLVLEPAIVFRG